MLLLPCGKVLPESICRQTERANHSLHGAVFTSAPPQVQPSSSLHFFLKVIIIKSSSYDKTNRQKEGFMELMSGFTGSSLPVVRTVKIETSGGRQMGLKSLKSVAEGKNDLIK